MSQRTGVRHIIILQGKREFALSQKYSDKLAAIQQSICKLKDIPLCFTDLVKTNFNLNYIYRAVNTLRLGYKNQSVNAVQGNNSCLFSDPHRTQIHCGQNVKLLNVSLRFKVTSYCDGPAVFLNAQNFVWCSLSCAGVGHSVTSYRQRYQLLVNRQ